MRLQTVNVTPKGKGMEVFGPIGTLSFLGSHAGFPDKSFFIFTYTWRCDNNIDFGACDGLEELGIERHLSTYRPGQPSRPMIVLSTNEAFISSKRRYMQSLGRKLVKLIKEKKPHVLDPNNYNWAL